MPDPVPCSNLTIGNAQIGGNGRCYIIAEAGVNHNGDLTIARRLIDAAAEAGADAVKFQTFSAERLAAPTAARAAYQKSETDQGGQLEMLKRLELSADDHEQLFHYAEARNITFLSTPFDCQSADLLDGLGVAAFKIGSGDLTDSLLLSHVAAKGRPVILSTGGATLKEVGDALRVIKTAGDPSVALLHCVSTYPAKVETVNLRAINTLAEEFGVPTGFSDHTPGLLAPVIAVSLGAKIIEKHMTLSQVLAGPDHRFSLEPADFKKLIARVRQTEDAMGHGRKEPLDEEKVIMSVVRKSLFAAKQIEAGSIITGDDLVALRPAEGISPMDARQLIGHVACRTINAGEMMRQDMVEQHRDRSS